MKINWNEASTRRGAVGLVLGAVCIAVILFDDDYEKKVVVLLALGKGISDYLKFTLPDHSK